MALVCCTVGAAGRALATPPRRIAIVIGSNSGLPHEPTLRFARRDAARVSQTLRELGSVAQRDLFQILDGDAASVRRAFEEIARRAKAEDRPTMLFFYYSGHANAEALHLGPSALKWDELRRLLDGSGASLRVAIVDACQAGAMTDKGMSLAPQLEAPPESHGTAILASASSSETSQEALSLGGSFFTHFLVSGLRGAADSDDDGRVTLAEAYAYTARHTQKATGAWARAVQHPSYQFDISGQGDVVLTELQEASALLTIDRGLDGYLVVSERDSPLVVVETEKRAGQALRLALPSGRYHVHLRRPNAVYLTDVTLPWGGRAVLGIHDFVPRSYQEVAQKGGLIEIHRHRLRAGVAVTSPIVAGMDALVAARVGYGVKLGPIELALRLTASETTFHAIDTVARTTIAGAALLVTYERPLKKLDLRLWLVGEGQYWRQQVAELGTHHSAVFGVGIGLGLRIPIATRLFAEGSIEGMGYFPTVTNTGTTFRPAAVGELGLGLLL